MLRLSKKLYISTIPMKLTISIILFLSQFILLGNILLILQVLLQMKLNMILLLIQCLLDTQLLTTSSLRIISILQFSFQKLPNILELDVLVLHRLELFQSTNVFLLQQQKFEEETLKKDSQYSKPFSTPFMIHAKTDASTSHLLLKSIPLLKKQLLMLRETISGKPS